MSTVFKCLVSQDTTGVMNATEEEKRSTKRSSHGGRVIRFLNLQLDNGERKEKIQSGTLVNCAVYRGCAV